MPIVRLLIILATLTAATAADADRIERRGGAPPLEGAIVEIDDGGVRIRSELGALHDVSWDRVRAIDTDRAGVGLESRLEAAADLWRARTRVERHDLGLAEPILERHFAMLKGQTHETALVVAEGLLRCRLARGANARAVIPALEVIRLRRGGVATDSYGMLEPVFDPDYELCPQLPPFWVDGAARRRLAHELEGYEAGDDRVVGMLADAYRAALGDAADEVETRGKLPRGVELVDLLSRLVRGDADAERRSAVVIRSAADEQPAWVEAWVRFGAGSALLEAPGEGQRQRGMLHLAHVASRFGDEQPFLAGLALALLADELLAQDRAEAAQSVRAELQNRFPTHPATRLAGSFRLVEDEQP